MKLLSSQCEQPPINKITGWDLAVIRCNRWSHEEFGHWAQPIHLHTVQTDTSHYQVKGESLYAGSPVTPDLEMILILLTEAYTVSVIHLWTPSQFFLFSFPPTKLNSALLWYITDWVLIHLARVRPHFLHTKMAWTCNFYLTLTSGFISVSSLIWGLRRILLR